MRWSLPQPRGEQAAFGPQLYHGARHPEERQAAGDVLGKRSVVVNGVLHPTIMCCFFLYFIFSTETSNKNKTSHFHEFCVL